MAAVDPLTTGFLLVETLQSSGEPVWVVKWRSADGTRVRRRLGARAWLERDAGGSWRPRGGRPREGWLTEFRARRRMAAFVEAAEAEVGAPRARTAVAQAAFEPTFRALAHAWLEYLEFVQRAKPTTLRDYRLMLAEPGVHTAAATGERSAGSWPRSATCRLRRSRLRRSTCC